MAGEIGVGAEGKGGYPLSLKSYSSAGGPFEGRDENVKGRASSDPVRVGVWYGRWYGRAASSNY